MKNFTYTARDTSGATKKGSLRAADRIAVLQVLKAQGLVPVFIVEGAAPREAFRLKLSPQTLLLACTVVVLIVGAVFLMQDRKPEVRKQKVEVKKVEKNFRARTAVEKAALPLPSVEATPVKALPPQVIKNVDRPRPEVTDPVPTVAKSPKRRRVEVIPGMSTNSSPDTGYSSGTERVINMIMNAQLGIPPPPLPNLPPGENIAEILERDIILYDADSEKTAIEKANVAYAKQLLKDYVKQGGSTENFLQFYHAELTEAFEERSAAQKYAADLFKAGDEKGAARYMEEKNKELTEKGIQPIKVFGLIE